MTEPLHDTLLDLDPSPGGQRVCAACGALVAPAWGFCDCGRPPMHAPYAGADVELYGERKDGRTAE